MVLKVYLAACLLLVATPLIGLAQDESQTDVVPEWVAETPAHTFTITPSVTQLFGNTTYEIKALAEIPTAPGSLSEIRSELEFPLTAMLAGVTLDWVSRSDKWGAQAAIGFNIDDPSDSMIDRDWMGGIPVSYTESDAAMDMVLGHVEARYGVGGNPRTSLWLLARFEYQKISEQITGFAGWQDIDMDGDRVDVSGTGQALDYEITYLTPQLGVASRIFIGQTMPLNLTIAAGVLFASDTDDHLLRGRVSTSDATGLSVNTNFDLRLLSTKALGGSLFLDFRGWLRYYYATGEQTQTWYQDEGDIAAGTVISGIAYTVDSMQYGLGLGVGLEF